MKNQIAKEILDRYLNGETTAEEQALVETWYNSLSEQQQTDIPIDFDRRYKQLLLTLPSPEVKKAVRLWPRVAIAAAVTAIFLGTGLFYVTNQINTNGAGRVTAGDVDPGGEGATLQLANGQKIRINNVSAGNLTEQSGVKISKTADGEIIYEISDNQTGKLEYNTLSTTRGEHTRLRLPDGSLVFLNAASSLTYPTSFANSENRRVSLTGEGYFEISKDKAHPFLVESKGQTIEVLGTHFNVNSYPEEAGVATTLLEGSVKINANGREQIIRPNEQALASASKISVKTVDVEEIIDWKQGDFYLNNVSLQNAMRKIARWYNVDVVYDSSVPMNLKSTGYISRKNKLSAVLRLIEKSGDVHFKIEGKTVYVSK
ncbi:FecR family protein [Sphingobacterium athyrii]|nr:FecR family protein [Sphingobacterium athyrii]